MPRLTRRKMLAGSVPLIGAGAAALHGAVPHAHPWGDAQAAPGKEHGAGHPPTIHWHGIHPAAPDGVPGIGAGQIKPGGSTTYEFTAEPFGLHLYHCHVRPLAEHIAKGMYGALIIDPKEPRPDADELVMVMNGFDTNFDRANEVYAVNTV